MFGFQVLVEPQFNSSPSIGASSKGDKEIFRPYKRGKVNLLCYYIFHGHCFFFLNQMLQFSYNFQVVFLDAHHFPIGFYNADNTPIRSVHAGLLELVQRELGPHLAPASEFGTGPGTRGPTMQTLLNAQKRLVFSYVDSAIVGGKNFKIRLNEVP